jgi:hypothetical protein
MEDLGEEEMWHRRRILDTIRGIPANNMARRKDGARNAGQSELLIEGGYGKSRMSMGKKRLADRERHASNATRTGVIPRQARIIPWATSRSDVKRCLDICPSC